MSGIPFINDPAVGSATFSLWDTMQLGGIVWPGLWAMGATKKRSLDIVKVRRKDGTMTLDNGYFGAELKAFCRIWTKEQWDRLQVILPNFDPQRAGGGRSPLDIYHPSAALLSCSQVYIEEFGVPPPGSPAQSVVLTINMVQWCSDLKIFVQGFAGTRKAGDSLEGITPVPPSSNTGDKL